jgi:hypothetical protein
LVTTIGINPFVYPSSERPRADDPVWPGVDHPFLNRLRQIRADASGKELVAGIICDQELLGVGGRQRRQVSFDEITWKTVAVIGAGFRGVIWQWAPREPDPIAYQIRRLEQFLLRHSERLARASPVGWQVRERTEQALTVLEAKDCVFLALLSPEYMRLAGDGKSILHPIASPGLRIRVALAMPVGVRVGQAEALSGSRVVVEEVGGGIMVSCAVGRAAELIVLRLAGPLRSFPAPVATGPSSTSTAPGLRLRE